MNILIIDDDQNYLKNLKQTVTEVCEKEEVPIKIKTDDDPLSVVNDQKYKHSDIVLLDIDMPDMTGIETASKINERKGNSDKPYIIFVTNRDDLVFEALREQPYSFVRKSHLEDLRTHLLKIQEKLSIAETYYIKSGREIECLIVKDIIYLEKEHNYVLFHTESGVIKERTTIDSKMLDLIPHGFLRPQIGYLVNVRYIDEIKKSTVLLSNGKEIPISKKYRKNIKDEFYDWMVNRR